MPGRQRHSRGKNFHDVRACAPGGKDLGRRECAGEDRDAEHGAGLDRREIEARADDELRAGIDAGAGGIGIEHGAGADEDVAAEALRRLFDDCTAPGTVIVISSTGMAPAQIASTAANVSSADFARTTGMMAIWRFL
jgi:hypothetical protein